MAFTVTATPGGASFSRGVDILVRVLTNATETGGASNGNRSTVSAAAAGTLTPNFSSSWVGFSISSDGNSTEPAAATNNTYDFSPTAHTDGWIYRGGHYTGTVTASTPLTYGASAAGSGSDHENWCALEIPASGGTITIDGSSPAGVENDTGLSATTGSFTPPVGSVLVAMVAAGGSGAGAGVTCAMSDTSGLGLVWTQRVTSSSVDNFQPTFIFTATVPAVGLTLFNRSLTAQPSRTWLRRYQKVVRPPIPPAVQQVSVHAGVATVTAKAPDPPGFKPFIYKLGGTGYNAWFTDRNGNPKLMLSEQAWALPWNAGRWNSGNWQSDFDAYFSTRAAQGYNAWYGIVWGNSHVDSAALSGGRSWDGVYPLTVNGTPGAIATGSETVALNNTFWTRIDAFIATAMRNGVTVFMNLSMSYDISDVGGIWQNATNTQAGAFGAALAARYPVANWPNLQWFWGDDDDGPNDSFYQAMLTGIQGAGDTRPLISIEQFTNTNSHIAFSSGGAFSGAFGAPNATYNYVYSYDAPYFGVEESYTEGGTFTHIPPAYLDGVYYGDTGSGTNTDRVMRTFAWWALSSGARGFTATSGPSDLGGGGLWTWQSDAVSRLSSDPNGAGTWTTSQAGAVKAYLTGLTDWQKLIPDTGNVFITAGRGTRGTCDTAGGVFNFRNTNAYVCGSITPTGTLAVIYCKAAMSITIDQTKLGAGYTATWVDPANLATQGTATGSTYASGGLGNNSAGDPDWVLVLQGPPAVSAPAGAAAVSVAATSALAAVTVTAGVAAVSVVAPAATAAETVTAGVAVVSAVAPAPAVTTSGGTSAPAGVAAVSVVALAATAAETVAAGVAVVSVVAPAAQAATTTTAGVGVVSAAAPAPRAAATTSAGVAAVSTVALTAQAAITATAGVGVVGAVATAATVNTSGSQNALAGVAAVSVVAPAATAAETVTAGVGVVGVVAPGASVSTFAGTNAPAGVAAVQARAMAPSLAATAGALVARVLTIGVNVPPPFTVGTLTAAVASSTLTAATASGAAAGGTLTASDTRTGGPGG